VPTDLGERLGALGRALPGPSDGAEERLLAGVLAAWKPARRRRALAPRLLLAAALALLGGGSLAYAVKGTILERADRPAPVRIPLPVQQAIGRFAGIGVKLRPGLSAFEQTLARNAAAGLATSSTRLVLQIPTRFGGHASLYAAMTDGIACHVVTWTTMVATSCSPPSPRPPAIDLGTSSLRYPHVLVVGRVSIAGATRVELRTAHGERPALRLSGGWFLYELPLRYSRHGADPIVSISAFDRAGKRVATLANPWRLTPLQLRAVERRPA
jgi:hypothetical protein